MGQDQENTQTDAAGVQGGQGDAAAARSALVRKAVVGREEHQARAMTLPKALRLTAAKVANEMFDMALAVIGFRAERHAGDALAPLFDDAGLLMLLEGPDRQRAAAMMDANFVTALIQQQTMGKVTPAPEGGETRTLTDTDAAICAPFLDALLSRVTPLPEVPSEQALVAGYVFGARTQEPRLLLMALEAQAYRVLHLTVDIEGGRRQGKLMLCLPDAVGEGGHGTAGSVTPAGVPVVDPQKPRTLTEPVMALTVDLPVALTRVQLPLSQLSQLKVGDSLPLDAADFGAVRVLTPQGKTLGRGSLGQVNGLRALRITSQTGAQAGAATFGDADGFGTGAPSGATGLEMAEGAMPEGLPDLPEMSDLPELEGMAGADTAPLPDVGDLPDMSDLPEMSDLPDLGDMPDLPDMSDLPDFDDLPELEDLKAG